MYGSTLEAVRPSLDIRYLVDLLKLADKYDVPDLDPDIAGALNTFAGVIKNRPKVTWKALLGPAEEIFALPKKSSSAVRNFIAKRFDPDVKHLVNRDLEARIVLERTPELALRLLDLRLARE